MPEQLSYFTTRKCAGTVGFHGKALNDSFGHQLWCGTQAGSQTIWDIQRKDHVKG